MNNINPIWLRYGVLYGIFSILISLISFYLVKIGSGTQLIISFVIMILFMVLASKAEKSMNDGILSYGDTLKTTFLTSFLGLMISGLFLIIMVHLIDPSLIDKIIQQSLDFTRWMMGFFGAPEDQIENAMEEAESKVSESVTPLNQIINILIMSLFYLIIAAIVSIFVKKDYDPSKIN